MQKLDEKALTLRILQGDKSAFSIVFTHYYTDLVMFAGTFLRNRQMSEEVVQNVFIRLWENRNALIITSLKSFLLKSVQNRCIDSIRHNRIRDIYQNYAMNISPLLENDTENYILYSELEEHLEKALSKLPEELNRVFSLNRFEGKTYPEIAAVMNVSVRTVEARMGRALAILREALKDFLMAFLAVSALLFR